MKVEFKDAAIYAIGIMLIVTVAIIYFNSLNADPNKKLINNDETVTIVRNYFEAWDQKDYERMYSQISDGFKAKEATANNLQIFRYYIQSTQVDRVRIIDLSLIEKNKDSARVSYSVELISMNGVSNLTSSEFSLKYRINDSNPGWKLIHPYGSIVDN